MNTSRNKSTASFISRLRTNAPSAFAFSSQPGGITDSNRLKPASSPLIPSAYQCFYALLSKRIWGSAPLLIFNLCFLEKITNYDTCLYRHGVVLWAMSFGLLAVSDESLEQAAAVLRGGGLAAFPTETVYGLGADAFNTAALAKIFEAKGRPRFDPLIIHIAAISALERIVCLSQLGAAARHKLNLLTEKFWPGPLTLILPKQAAVPGLATSGLPTVAVRFPDHQAAQKLIVLAGGAVAAPSANPFGYLSPTRAEHVRDMLGEKADIILDGGPAKVGVESTVLDLCGEQPRILRPGGAPKEAIETLIGTVLAGEDTEQDGVVSPGQLKSHYAPRRPLSIHSPQDMIALDGEAGSAFLFFDSASRDAWLAGGHGGGMVKVLSETGDPIEAAARLFETLHELDQCGVARIHAQLAPQTGLGAAINDRLRRGSNSH
jgi:L-threonylcarbamoyladenylate synthase